MLIYWLCLIPFLIWFSGLLFAADRLNSPTFRYLFMLAAVLCCLAGLALFHYQTFHIKSGFFAIVFAVPLIFAACFEGLRLLYKAIRHENPCINVRSGRWLGDRPVEGFFTTYPADKVISGADVLFGISQMLISLVITLTLFICSLALNW